MQIGNTHTHQPWKYKSLWAHIYTWDNNFKMNKRKRIVIGSKEVEFALKESMAKIMKLHDAAHIYTWDNNFKMNNKKRIVIGSKEVEFALKELMAEIMKL